MPRSHARSNGDEPAMPHDVALVRPYIAERAAPAADPASTPPVGGPAEVVDPLAPEAASGRPAGAGPVDPGAPPPGGTHRQAGRPARDGGSANGRTAVLGAAWLAVVATAAVVGYLILPSDDGSRPPAVAVPVPPTPTPPTPPTPTPPALASPSASVATATKVATTAASKAVPATRSQSTGPTRTGSTTPPPATRAAGPTGAPPPHGVAAPGSLGPGDRGPEVTRLQQRLYAVGKTYVEPTGSYDDDTRAAVAEVQREWGISGDPPGVYGPATKAALS